MLGYERPESGFTEASLTFRHLVERAPDIIAAYDHEFRHTYINPAVQVELGIPVDAFLGRTLEEAGIDPDVAAEWQAALARSWAGELVEVAFSCRTPAGVQDYQFRVVPERAGGDEVFQLIAIGRNVTAQRRLEAELRESEERFRELAAHLDSIFWLWSVDEKRLLYVSPAYETMWGRSRESLYADPGSFLSAIHPEDRERVRVAASTLLRRTSGSVEYRVTQPDGMEHWVCSRGFGVRGPRGRVYRIAGITEDITQRKHAEQDRERVLEILGHDLRNPLTSILLNTEVALAAAQQERCTDVDAPLRDVIAGAEMMRRLVEDILTAATLRGGGIQLRRRWCDVGALLHQAMERIRPIATDREITLHSAAPAGLTVLIDSERILQALNNLLSNATRFTPSGGEIEMRAEKRGSRVWLSVTDTGPGIDEEDLPRLFERYWQANRTTGSGSGLGLTIVKGIVEAHQGRVWAASNAGVGSTFVLSLPVQDRDAA
jgi:PAS domain S-box-containing protein